jgi:hypothetical protein
MVDSGCCTRVAVSASGFGSRVGTIAAGGITDTCVAGPPLRVGKRVDATAGGGVIHRSVELHGYLRTLAAAALRTSARVHGALLRHGVTYTMRR